MATSSDYKRIWERYQEEGIPKSQSIVQFSPMNGIAYTQFEKWCKKYNTIETDYCEFKKSKRIVFPISISDEDLNIRTLYNSRG